MQPDYYTTLDVYLYLYEHAKPDGLVPQSLRELATGLDYKSWSTVRWHLKHLEKVGLINKGDGPRGKATISIADMSVKSPDLAYHTISQEVRIPWKKEKQLAEFGQTGPVNQPSSVESTIGSLGSSTEHGKVKAAKKPGRQPGTDAAMTTTFINIFGATGNLARRKLIPALFDLHCKGQLPPGLKIIGIAPGEMTTPEFRDLLQDPEAPPEQWAGFANRISYIQADAISPEDMARAWESIARLAPGQDAGRANCLYYLALRPGLYAPAITALAAAGMTANGPGWRRVVIEKPFGSDGRTARSLNEHLHEHLNEDQIYRIDHYLGKETVQNLLVLRFANSIFEPIWNRNYINKVEIAVAEEDLVGERGEYYDASGVLRDMFQSHLLQLLTLVAMDPPHSFNADALRNEKVKVLSAVRRPSLREIEDHLIIGQYEGYHYEPGVAPRSQTPTYAALRLFIDNWRWQGVPFHLRSGKGLAAKYTEMTISFRSPPHMLFPVPEDTDIPGNTLSIRIQPDEGVKLELQSKVPGAGLRMQPVNLEFHYHDGFTGLDIPDAYERLLLDAIAGDASLFTRSDEIELAWSIIDPIMQRLDLPGAPTPYRYLPGMHGVPN